jgi:HD-GYP domain-containing protein (c-di-GMP phosphodiesterase class II)
MYGNSASLAPVNIFTPSGLMNLGYDSLSPMHALWLLDPDTRTHSYRVAHIAEKMGTGLGLDGTTIDDLKKAGLLHDVGKIAVQSIVLKLGKLTVEEQDGIIWHPIYSGIIL